MNDLRLDAKIVAAAKRRSDATSIFTTTVMQKIRARQAADSLGRLPVRTTIWSNFMKFTRMHTLAFGLLAAVMVSIVGFTSYAYAIGSDPISLIKRWVEGNSVKIEYQDRSFEHGKDRTYSDAAVTAYAEVNTVTDLAFRAQDNLQIPKDGIEHVSLPANIQKTIPYESPYFATITAVTGDTVTFHSQYSWGDKMTPSKDLDKTVSVPLADFRYYDKGEPVPLTAEVVGKLTMVFPYASIRHYIGKDKVEKTTTYFSFSLSHELAAFKEASFSGDISTQSGGTQALFEPSWGGLSQTCLNNGADTCDLNHFSKQTNQGLFVANQSGGRGGSSAYNPSAIAYGEGAADNAQPQNVIPRNLEGHIVRMDASSITIKTSSGAEWQLAYSQDERIAFAKHYGNELKVGDKLAGQIVVPIYLLDLRRVEHRYLISLERY